MTQERSAGYSTVSASSPYMASGSSEEPIISESKKIDAPTAGRPGRM